MGKEMQKKDKELHLHAHRHYQAALRGEVG